MIRESMPSGVEGARSTFGESGVSPLRVTLLFALFGTAWIVLTSWWFARTRVEPSAIPQFELVKGLFFIAASSSFLYAVLMFENRRRRRSQQELEAAQGFLRRLYGNLDDAILVVEARRRTILDCNEAAEVMFGYRRDELIGRSTALLHPDQESFEELGRAGEIAVRRDGVYRGEHRMRRANGESFEAEHTELLFDDERHRLRIVRDISSRKAEERALRESRSLLDSVLEYAEEGIVFVSAQGEILFANAAAAAIAGGAEGLTPGSRYEPERFEVRDLDGEVVDPAELPFARAIRTGRPVRDADLVYLRGSADERILSVNAAPVFDESGNVVGAVSCFRDRTEAHRAEQALRQREEQLQKVRRMEAVGRLAGGVAHDFNNLLTAILGFAGLASEAASRGDPVNEELDEIRRAAEQATDLIGQLLAFSRQQVRKPLPVDPDRVLENVSKMLDRMVGETVRLEATLERRGAWILADPGQLEQVVVNLVLNARDAMPDGGTVFLEADVATFSEGREKQGVPIPPGRYYRFVVRDEGVGIEPEHLPHLFEPFYTTKRPGEGTGLGLSTVYGIVKQNGGFVWVDSEPGRGARFEVLLPLTMPPAEEVAGCSVVEEEDEATASGETILLVEDEEAVRKLLRRMLASRGYEVREARDGEEGLAILRESAEPPDLLLTDVVMPGLDGRALAKRARERFPGLPVLFISGYSEQVVSHFGRVEEGIDLLEKPFEPKALFAKIRSLLG